MSRITFITRNFPPLVGGMERLAREAVNALNQQWPVELIGPQGCGAWTAVPVIEVDHRSAARFLLTSWWAAGMVTDSAPRQAVVGGSGLAAASVLMLGRRSNSPTACFVHGLDLVARHPVYRAVCMTALRRIDLIIANSHNTARLAVANGIPEQRVRILYPGTGIPTGQPTQAFADRFPQTRGRPLLLFVGRLMQRKGLVEFAQEVLPGVISSHPDVLLVVVGGDAPDALHGKSRERERLEQAVHRHGLQRNILMLGGVDDATLDAAYAAARLHVFPVRDLPGDVEGFGMVALEAAMRGTPTLAYAAGGVADAVADGRSGWLIPPGDTTAMTARVRRCLAGDCDQVTLASCQAFARDFDWAMFADRLRRLIVEVTARP